MYDDDEDADLRAAIAASLEQPQPEAAPAPASAAERSGNPEVLTGFSTCFRCYAAAAVGRKDIDATGKILLPQSALHALLAKLPEMPSTLLLRLSHEGSAAYVGVAEFIEDAEMSALLTRVAGQAVRSDALPRLFRGGPLAVCFVPRWVRAALLLEPSQPELSCHVVSLPLAAALRLQPRDETFAAALALEGDVRATLTELMNRFVAVAAGDTLQLSVGGNRYQVDVLECRGLLHVRGGAVGGGGDGGGGGGGGSVSVDDVGGAGPGLAAAVVVPAVCLVDSNVEVEFAPSAAEAEAEIEREIERERAAARQAAAEQAARERQAATEQSAREATAAAEAACEAQAREAQVRREARGDAAAALPAEPAAGEGVTTVLVRMPDGPRISRRFDKAAPLRLVRRWVEASSPAEMRMVAFELVSTYPRFVATEQNAEQTLEQAGLHPQATMFVKEPAEA